MTTEPIKIAETGDGSWTCYNAQIGEHYHNRGGAYTEALNVYVLPSALEERLARNSELVVYDPFFGLGYNTLVLMDVFEQLQQSRFPEARLTVWAVEWDPEILVHFPRVIQESAPEDLKKFLSAFEHKIYYQTQDGPEPLFPLPSENTAQPGIQAVLMVGDTRIVTPRIADASVDLIYHDAFSTTKQPELWTQQLFDHYARILKPDVGTMITYGAAAPMRQALHMTGMDVRPLPAYDRKSGTAAYHGETYGNTLTFSPLERGLMACKSGIPYEDNATLTWTSAEILAHRAEVIAASTLATSSSVHREFGYYKEIQR